MSKPHAFFSARYNLAAACVMLFAIALSAIAPAACGAAHGGPVIGTGEKPPEMNGTISGVVRAAGSNAPLSARKVTAVEVTTGAKFEASTSSNGGYTMKVPMGRYRLEVELRPEESVSQAPDELVINRSDLDSGRDFVIAVKPGSIAHG